MESFGLFNLLKTMLFSANTGNAPQSYTAAPPTAQNTSDCSPSPNPVAEETTQLMTPTSTQTQNVPSDEAVEQNAFLLLMDAHERRVKKIKR